MRVKHEPLTGFAESAEPRFLPLPDVADWVRDWAVEWGEGAMLVFTHPNRLAQERFTVVGDPVKRKVVRCTYPTGTTQDYPFPMETPQRYNGIDVGEFFNRFAMGSRDTKLAITIHGDTCVFEIAEVNE